MLFNTKEFDFQGIFYKDIHLSCKDFKKAVFSLADYIKRNISEKSSPFIYLVADNHPKTIIAYFSILHAGFSCVIIDPDWKTLEWNYIRSDTPPSAIIRIVQETSIYDFSKDILFLPDAPPHSFDEKRGYTIVYTAAEDGYPKGALLSQHNLMTDAYSKNIASQANHDDIVCALLPLSHLYGLTMGVIAPILSHSGILVENVKNINALESIMDDLKEHSVSYFYTIPVLIFLLGNIPDVKNKLKSLKVVATGGYKLPETVFTNFKRKFDLEILEGYGLTEASPVCSWHAPGDKIKIDSVGKPFSCCQFKVVDDKDNLLSINEIGELCVKGENVFEGYYRKPEFTKTIIKDGWLHTSDKGKIDRDGYIYITGLLKDMVHVGGRNVYPKELKRLLLLHGNIKSIDLSYTDSPLTGTKISAMISMKRNTPDLQSEFMKWCIQNISAYKLPKIWTFTD